MWTIFLKTIQHRKACDSSSQIKAVMFWQLTSTALVGYPDWFFSVPSFCSVQQKGKVTTGELQPFAWMEWSQPAWTKKHQQTLKPAKSMVICIVPISYIHPSHQTVRTGSKSYLCQLKGGHNVRIPCRSARIRIHLCYLIWARKWPYEPAGNVLMSSFQNLCLSWPLLSQQYSGLRGISVHLKLGQQDQAPADDGSGSGSYVDIQYYYLCIGVWENCSPQVQADLWTSPSFAQEDKKKSGERPTIIADQDELLPGKEPESKKCRLDVQDLKSQYSGEEEAPFLLPSPQQMSHLQSYEIVLFLNDKDISPDLIPPFQMGLLPTQKWCG